MSTVDEQLSFAKARLPRSSLSQQSDGIYVLRWDLVLVAPWSPSITTMVVLVPPMFPAQAPSGFDAVGDVRLNGASPAGAGLREIGQDRCTHFCWNPAGAIDYTTEDAIWRFAKFSETRFMNLQ